MVTPLTIQRRLKTSFDSQHVKRLQTQVKSSWEQFYRTFSSLWGEIYWKISPWFKFEITGLFVNTWTADYKDPVLTVRICRSLFKSGYIKNKKYSLSFFFHLRNLHEVLNVFKKKKTLIANVFLNLRTE